jgi:curved DNA-binding protein CbpA
MASSRTHYSVLNVAPDAEPVVIEAAYRALMKKYHPDQAAPAEEGAAARPVSPTAADINNAFAVLRDPQRRSDYDHREAVRVQAIQLAQYQQALPPPARRSNFFGWGGWLVSLLLAGAIGIIASQSGGVPPLPRVETAKAAALGEAGPRSQPAIPVANLVPPSELAEIRSDALLGRAQGHDVVPVDLRLRPLHVPRPHSPPRRRGGGHAAPADKDFVERHGGIY